MSALKAMGITTPIDGASGSIGAYWFPQILDPKTETRSDARTAYYDSASSRPNLHLLTGNQVTRLITKVRGSEVCVVGVEVRNSHLGIVFDLENFADIVG